MLKKIIIILLVLSVLAFPVAALTDYDETLTASLVCEMCRGESFLCCTAMAAVVLNRVESDAFPDTVTEVIRQNGAFPAAGEKALLDCVGSEEYERALRAVKLCESGHDPTGGAVLYTVGNEYKANMSPTLVCGDMTFGVPVS